MKHHFNTIAIVSIIILVDGSTSMELEEYQKHALEKIRSELKDDLVRGYMRQDLFLIPFLRVNKFDIPRASAMIQKSIKWRHDNGIDEILSEENPIDTELPHVKGIDKSGRPVMFSKMGNLDYRSIVARGKTHLALRSSWKTLESLATQARHANHTQIVIIMDPSGFSIRRQACPNCLHLSQAIGESYEANYPEMAAAVFFVNTPRLFEVMMNVLLAVGSDYSKKVLHIYGYDKNEWVPALLEWVSQEELSRIFGYEINFTAPAQNHTNYSRGNFIKIASPSFSNRKQLPTVFGASAATILALALNKNYL